MGLRISHGLVRSFMDVSAELGSRRFGQGCAGRSWGSGMKGRPWAGAAGAATRGGGVLVELDPLQVSSGEWARSRGRSKMKVGTRRQGRPMSRCSRRGCTFGVVSVELAPSQMCARYLLRIPSCPCPLPSPCPPPPPPPGVSSFPFFLSHLFSPRSRCWACCISSPVPLPSLPSPWPPPRPPPLRFSFPLPPPDLSAGPAAYPSLPLCPWPQPFPPPSPTLSPLLFSSLPCLPQISLLDLVLDHPAPSLSSVFLSPPPCRSLFWTCCVS